MDDAATVANSPSLVLRICEKVNLNATLNTQRCSLANPHLSITVLHPIITFKETIFLYWSSAMVLPSNCCCACVGIFSPHCYFSSQYFWGLCCALLSCGTSVWKLFFSTLLWKFMRAARPGVNQETQATSSPHIFPPSVHGGFFNTRKKNKKNKGRWGHFLITSHLSSQCLHSFYDITCTSCKSSPARHPANTAAVRTYIM